MTFVFALIGAKALYYTFLWLASAIGASWLSDRKGYGEKAGLATGLILTVVGLVIWLFIPAREGSRWKRLGPIRREDPLAGSDVKRD
jgi:fucose permease